MYTFTNNLDLNNHRIVNVLKVVSQNDAVTLEQLGQSHITQHINRVNILKYIMEDDSERDHYRRYLQYTGIPHKINKQVYQMGFTKKEDDTYNSRFGFNLFNAIRDNFNTKYTLCIEIYFPPPFKLDEFNNSTLDITALNFSVDRHNKIKILQHLNI